MEPNQSKHQEQEQDAEITTPFLNELSTTPYACSTLTRLSGGTANFVYRGELRQPLGDGTTTVVLKHAEEFLAGWREFRLTADRCLIEEKILEALQTLPSSIQPVIEDDGGGTLTVQLKTPRLYYFSAPTHTQVQEDLPTAQDLKTYLTMVESGAVSLSLARAIGRALGEWLRQFHFWTEDVAQREMKLQMAQNRFMQDLKYSVNYDNLVKTVERFPGALEGSRDVFQKVRDLAFSEVGKSEGVGVGGIHGDFWTGNILLPRNLHQQSNTTATLFVTDWELTQCGPRALDLGQMIAELYMLKLFKEIDVGLWIIQAFVEEYRSRSALSVDVAFRTAIHAGVHLVAWGSTVPGWGSAEQIEDVVRVGRDLVVKGWEKDRKWFEESDLKCLFVE